MPKVGTFPTTARHVAGADISASGSLDSLIPRLLKIDGRISIETANKYLCELRFSKTTDLIVVALSPSEGASDDFQRLWAYFHTRRKYGVIESVSIAAVRDAYVIPVDKGTGPLPEFMEILEDNKIGGDESGRPDCLLLVAFVVKPTDASTDSAVPTPTGSSHPALGTTTTTTTTTTPTTPVQPAAMTPPRPTIDSILGPLAETSTVAQQLLSQASDLNEKQLMVIKGILERVPAAKDDLALFSDLLAKQSAASDAAADKAN